MFFREPEEAIQKDHTFTILESIIICLMAEGGTGYDHMVTMAEAEIYLGTLRGRSG